jgi:phosphatidylethanolamine-binding protein (PEBP) family uncharacterized protein
MRLELIRSMIIPIIASGVITAANGQQSAAGPQLTLSSPTVKDMEPLPLRYTQTGTKPSTMMPSGMISAAVNPPMEWTNVPAGTNAFVLILSDHVDFDVGSRQHSRQHQVSA